MWRGEGDNRVIVWRVCLSTYLTAEDLIAVFIIQIDVAVQPAHGMRVAGVIAEARSSAKLS